MVEWAQWAAPKTVLFRRLPASAPVLPGSGAGEAPLAGGSLGDTPEICMPPRDLRRARPFLMLGTRASLVRSDMPVTIPRSQAPLLFSAPGCAPMDLSSSLLAGWSWGAGGGGLLDLE